MQILKGLGAEFLAPWRVWHIGIRIETEENRPGDQERKSFLPDINEADVAGTCNRLQSIYLTFGVCILTYFYLLIFS